MKRRFAWLGTLAAVAGAAFCGAIDAAASIVMSGEVDPARIGKTAFIGGLAAVGAYFKRSPRESPTDSEMRQHVQDLDGGQR